MLKLYTRVPTSVSTNRYPYVGKKTQGYPYVDCEKIPLRRVDPGALENKDAESFETGVLPCALRLKTSLI